MLSRSASASMHIVILLWYFCLTVCVAVCLSVCLSAQCWYCVKTQCFRYADVVLVCSRRGHPSPIPQLPRRLWSVDIGAFEFDASFQWTRPKLFSANGPVQYCHMASRQVLFVCFGCHPRSASDVSQTCLDGCSGDYLGDYCSRAMACTRKVSL